MEELIFQCYSAKDRRDQRVDKADRIVDHVMTGADQVDHVMTGDQEEVFQDQETRLDLQEEDQDHLDQVDHAADEHQEEHHLTLCAQVMKTATVDNLQTCYSQSVISYPMMLYLIYG